VSISVRPHALVLTHVFPDLAPERAVLEPRGIDVIDGARLTPAARLVAAEGCDALLVQDTPIDAAFIARLARCRVLGLYGAGVDNADVGAALRQGLAVVHVPDYGTEEVADHALCLLLACARGLAPLGSALRAGAWDYGAAARPLRRLRGRTLGIVGLGRIGRRLAAKARALELRVLGTDPAVGPAEAAAAGIDWRPFPDLLAASDFVSLHTPLVPATERLIGRAELALMAPGAYLINVARGGLVDEAALLEALDGRRLAGAGLDVLAVEPAAADHPLIHHPRVVMTPHSAWYSEEAMRDLQRLLAEDVLRVLRGERPRCPVTGPEGRDGRPVSWRST
jgi:D-3-phosphoglycerate dehydrogenase / 2-oxoglutarate reductase